MRRPPPPHPRGAPRTAGSGRKKGTPNRRTVQMKELMTSLCHDVDYQHRLRADFRRRRVHPAIESLVWAHTVGKPAERVQLSADVTMSQKLDQERELFARLSVEDLEELARDNERLLAKARTMAQRQGLPPAAATVPGAPIDGGESNSEPDEQSRGTDVDEA